MRQMTTSQIKQQSNSPNGKIRNSSVESSHQKGATKTSLNHQLSELAYYSTQSQSTTEMSQGGGCSSIERPSQPSAGGIYTKSGSQAYLLTSPNRGQSSRLFKNVMMCPPIGPKTLFSPVMVGEKSFQTIHENTTISSSCHSSARKKKRTKVCDSSLN